MLKILSYLFGKKGSVKKVRGFARKLYQPDLAFSGQARSQVQEIAEERKDNELILESLGEGVLSVDGDLRVKYINYLASRMLLVPKKGVIGESLLLWEERAFRPLLQKAHALLKECLKRGCAVTDSLSTEEGRRSYFELIAIPKAQKRGVILILQDKSSHYKVLEVGKDFISNASHELRTPITIIKGFAETLHDMPDLPRDLVVDITEKIVRNCQRMDNLVKSLLTLADLENLPINRFQECDLVALVESCRQLILSVYPTAHVEIEKQAGSFIILGDPDILELAISNLLENAAKYSVAPAHIRVIFEENEKEIKMSIEDKGIGIPASSLEHIFDRFYTVSKAHSRRLGGVGLGLAIVKTIIEKHEGTISVSSIVGKGTTFTLAFSTRSASLDR